MGQTDRQSMRHLSRMDRIDAGVGRVPRAVPPRAARVETLTSTARWRRFIHGYPLGISKISSLPRRTDAAAVRTDAEMAVNQRDVNLLTAANLPCTVTCEPSKECVAPSTFYCAWR